MDNCLYCGISIHKNITWNLFSEWKSTFLCENCWASFSSINWGEACSVCGKPDSKAICQDCQQREAAGKQYLTCNHSICQYNQFAKAFMELYKYRGDYVLAKALGELLKKSLQTMSKNFIFCPIPLAEERLAERGFNQVTAILREAAFEYQELLIREEGEKQSKRSRAERLNATQVFHMGVDVNLLADQSILLVDDIYTTGATLNLAAKVFYDKGFKHIESLTIFR